LLSLENLHHVRELLDEIFGAENFFAQIVFTTTTSEKTTTVAGICDYLLWYARDIKNAKFRPLFTGKEIGGEGGSKYTNVELPDGTFSSLKKLNGNIPTGGRLFRLDTLTSQRPGGRYTVTFNGQTYRPEPGYWKPSEHGFNALLEAKRVRLEGKRPAYVRYFEDFSFFRLANVWADLSGIQSRTDSKIYSVQTPSKVIERCMLMCTDPGDLVVDPTCGAGTTAYVAEEWGRRWITIDTSRVPLALARQRLLTATFPWFTTRDNGDVPAMGFRYERKQNRNGEEVGGIVPHVTLKSIANNEPPDQEVLVDRPEADKSVTRVTGPFAFEATIPTPFDVEGQERPESEREAALTASADAESYADRMLDVLTRSPMLRLDGNRTVQLHSIRIPARTLSLSADAMVDASAEGQEPTLGDVVGEAAERNGALLEGITRKPVAIVFGPENGAVSEGLVFHAAKEANGKNYTHLYVIGFAIEAEARQFIKNCAETMGIAATYVQATMDLKMGDLLKNMRSSQIFSVCGLPEIAVRKTDGDRYEVELLGLDVFNPITMENHHASGNDVPAWFLDTDYNGLCFHVTQAFFPRTGAWDALKKSLKADYDESLWDHLSGKVSAPFGAGDQKNIAVKVIDARGNELMVVKSLSEATA
jgi:adenine-specific DNA-methyltransferase